MLLEYVSNQKSEPARVPRYLASHTCLETCAIGPVCCTDSTQGVPLSSAATMVLRFSRERLEHPSETCSERPYICMGASFQLPLCIRVTVAVT